VWQFIEPLAGYGICSTARPLARWRAGRLESIASVARRLLMLGRRPSGDVLIVQKAPVMPASLWPVARRLLERFAVPIVWDLDDAIWTNSERERRMAEGMCRTADVVVVGNDLLADWAHTAGAKRVEVIPTCFTPPLPISRSEASRPGAHIVWLGSPSTAVLLRQEEHRIREVLSAPGTRLTMIGGVPFDSMSDLEIDVVPWSPEAEHEHLTRADFGLALQPRTEFADHKCGFKIIQYMAYGVIPIATDGPVHRQIVHDVGLLVAGDTDAGDVQAFVTAGVADADRAAARDRWQAAFSTEAGAEAWASLLRSLIR
jgi:glycosyltransferase involved in cell wall biosynthesis